MSSPKKDRFNIRVKPHLVPVWNGANRVKWLVYDYCCAIACFRFGRCAVCGGLGLFLYRRRVVAPRLIELWGLSSRQARALAHKESGDCSRCGAKLRGRRIAQVLLRLYPSKGVPPRHWPSGSAQARFTSCAWPRSIPSTVCMSLSSDFHYLPDRTIVTRRALRLSIASLPPRT